jgi:hypothetical protein
MTGTTPQRGPFRLPAEISTVVWRHLVQIRHNPEQLLEVAIQPILFVLLFGVVLAGQMGGTDGDYLGYVVPGLIVQAAVLVTARTAIGLHADVNSGLMQRLQTLPINRFAPLAGRIIADLLMLLWSLTILLAAAVSIGYRANITLTAGIGGARRCFRLRVLSLLGRDPHRSGHPVRRERAGNRFRCHASPHHSQRRLR